jgi:DNA-binding CsgD family transcriptional regulator
VGSLVGRDGDLARSSAVLDDALAGTAGLVLLVGEAGVGKTTTLRALTGMATQRGFTCATGGCAEGVTGTSFAPFRAMFRRLAGAYDLRLVTAAIDASPAAALLFPAGLRSSSPSAASPDAGELYEAVLEVVAALAEECPLLIALEDLHWADRSTLELLSFVARNLASERAVLAGTVRTEDVAPDAPTGRTIAELGRLGLTTRLDLYGLDVASLRQLVADAGDPLDADVVEALHERTDGNPFYALELVAAGASGAGPLPPSVTDAVEIRLETLSVDDLEVVRAAAVAGSLVPSALAALLGRPEHDVESSLRAAVVAGVLVAEPETGELAFRHALVREVAYAGLLSSERRRLHQAVASQIEAAGGTDASVLAHHYAAAQRHADALRTSIAAARDAAGAYGSVDAVGHYSRAVAAWNIVPPADRPAALRLDDLLQEAMICAVNVGTVDEGAAFGSRLLDGLDPAVEPERWALSAARQAELRWELGDASGSEALLDRAGHHLEGRPDCVARVRVLERRAFQSVLTLRREEGLALAREALDVARRVGDPEAVVVALNRVALAATAVGEREGQALLHEAFEEAWRARLPHEMTRAAVNLLLLLHTGCRLSDATASGERVLAAADDLAVGPTSRAALTGLYARALVDCGEWDRADDLVAGIRLPNAQRLRSYVAIAVAEFATARGDIELARRMLAESRFDLVTVIALRRAFLEAELALAGGEPHVARSVADEYLPIAELLLDSSHARFSAVALRSLTKGDAVAANDYFEAARRRADAVAAAPAGAPLDQAAWLACAAASRASVVGEPSSPLWHEAATRFGEQGLVVRRGRAQLEEATAIVEEGGGRENAAALAADVHAFARRLGAVPLASAVESLVRRARLDIPGIERLAEGDLGLSPREAEVLRLVADGRTNREIADELFISVKTASVHVSHILRKVGATSRGEAAAIAHREGLVTGA